MLKKRAERAPQGNAIVAPGRGPLTYALLLLQVEHLAHSLHEMGVGRNDRVAIVLPNGPEMAVAFLGVAACATSAPLNPAFRAAEFDFFFSDLQPKALIVQSGADSPAIAIAQKHGIPIIDALPDAGREAGMFSLKSKRRACAFQVGFAEAEDVAVILHTSGTTSRSKLVPVTQASLYLSAEKVQLALDLSCSDRYLNVTPMFYSQGIMLTISSMLVGGSVVSTPGFSATHFFRWIEELHPTWYSAAPAIHQAILTQSRRNRDIIARYPLRFIRSAAAPLPPRLKAELENVFRSPVIEGYGMTECYPISSNPLPPRKRKSGSAGTAAGTEIAVIDEAGNFLPRGEIGEIVVSGPHVMKGYLNDPSNNENTFASGWFRTGDQGHIDSDGYLFVTGRIKEIINRGGEKISPREVDEVLLEHPAVSEAVTFAVPHVTLGEDVAAAVVLRDSVSVSVGEIRAFAAMRLAQFKVPRQLLIVKQLPKSATGKVRRIGLAEKLGLPANRIAGGKRRGPVVPRNSTQKKLVKIWAEVLGLGQIGVYDNFFDLGGHSLLATQIISRVRAAFQTEVSLRTLFEKPTVAELANAILAQQAEAPDGSALTGILDEIEERSDAEAELGISE